MKTPVDSTTHWAFDIGGISLLEDGNDFPIDDKLAVLGFDRAMEPAIGRVTLEHVDHVVEVNEWITDGHDVHFARGESSPGDQAPDTAKSIHSDLYHLSQGGIHAVQNAVAVHCTGRTRELQGFSFELKWLLGIFLAYYKLYITS